MGLSPKEELELLQLEEEEYQLSKKPDRGPMLAKMANEDRAAMPSVGPIESFAMGGMEGTLPGSSSAALRLSGGSKEDVSRFSQQAKAEQPIPYYAGYVGGMVNPVGLFAKVTKGAGAALKSSSLAGKLAPWVQRSLAGGTAMGAAQGTEALLKEEGVKEAGKEAAKGFAVGAISGPILEGIGNALLKGGNVAKKMFASLQGIKPETLETITKKGPEVAEALQNHTTGNLLPSYVADVSDKIAKFVSSRMGMLDDILTKNTTPISTKPFIDEAKKLVVESTRIQSTPLAVEQSNKLIQQLDLLKNLNGKLPAKDVNIVKKQFQEQLTAYYNNMGFSKDSLQDAVSKIEGAVRQELNTIPGVKNINDQLSKSIELQKMLKMKNVFKADGAFDFASSQRFFSTLGNEAKKPMEFTAAQLDKLIGTDLVEKAKIFSAVSQLAARAAEPLSVKQTGRSLFGPVVGGALGSAFGPIGTTIGTGVGMGLQSPMAIKPAMYFGGLANKVSKGTGSVISSEAAKRLIGKSILNNGEK